MTNRIHERITFVQPATNECGVHILILASRNVVNCVTVELLIKVEITVKIKR